MLATMHLTVNATERSLETVATTGTDSTDKNRDEKMAFRQAMDVFLPAMDAQDSGRSVDFAVLRKSMDYFWSEFPDAHKSVSLLTFYMDMYGKAYPDSVEAEWASFAECRSSLAAQLARGKVHFIEISRQPFAFSFIALDGREVDLSRLQGKIVLVDFWATWCAPCLKQIQVLKRLYTEYQTKGFEIVGISLDRAEDRQKLIGYVSSEQLAWPQHFDGKAWEGELVTRYAINSVPTTFLLNKEGRIVALNPTERELDTEIKRLLNQ